MFNRSLYLKDTPKAVIDLIEAATVNDEMDEMDWGDDVADALSAAQHYAAVLPQEQKNDHLQDKVEEATYEWNEEGDMDSTIALLDEAFQIQE